MRERKKSKFCTDNVIMEWKEGELTLDAVLLKANLTSPVAFVTNTVL